jgi:hypothetical protein
MTPFVHYMKNSMTPVGASSFLHFLINLQSISFLTNHVVGSLMYLRKIPSFPLLVPNCAFTISTISFSRALFPKYSLAYMPIVGNHVILVIRATSMRIGLSIHMMSPCTLSKSCFMHMPTFLPHLKCGTSRRFMIP